MDGNVKIALYTICKNESKFASRFINNILDSDYICILDTGSTDGTWEFLQEVSLKYPDKFIIKQKVFDNFRFDNARNEALSLVPEDADLCLKLDFDEYISKNWKKVLTEEYLKDKKNHHSFGYCLPYKEYRIFNNKWPIKRMSKVRETGVHCVHTNTPDWSWVFPVHEDLKSSESKLNRKIQGIEVIHTPDFKKNDSKIKFYDELLKLRYKEFPNDYTNIFYKLYFSFQNDFEKNSSEEVLKYISDFMAHPDVQEKRISRNHTFLLYFSIFAYGNNFSHFDFEELKKMFTLMKLPKVYGKQKRLLEKLIEYFKDFPYFNLVYDYYKNGEVDMKSFEISDKRWRNLDYHIIRESCEQVKDFLKKKENFIEVINPAFREENSLLLKKAQYHIDRLFGAIRSMEIINPLQNFMGIEVLCTDHCNLNCAYCNHFAPLAPEGYYKIDSYEKDISILSELFKDIIRDIKLMGGEPLLHPELIKMMSLTRKYFPDSKISILTNGILLLDMNKSFWKSCRKNKIKIYITPYKILNLQKIRDTCYANGVELEWYPDSMNPNSEKIWMSKFCVNPEGNTDVHRKFIDCGNANKTLSLRDGYLYTCPFKATVKFFNERFKYDLPVDPDINGIKLDSSSRSEILNFLCNPTELCKYCMGECGPVEWKRSERNEEEWLLDDDHYPVYLERDILKEV